MFDERYHFGTYNNICVHHTMHIKFMMCQVLNLPMGILKSYGKHVECVICIDHFLLWDSMKLYIHHVGSKLVTHCGLINIIWHHNQGGVSVVLLFNFLRNALILIIKNVFKTYFIKISLTFSWCKWVQNTLNPLQMTVLLVPFSFEEYWTSWA